jgi:hypothetical protein
MFEKNVWKIPQFGERHEFESQISSINSKLDGLRRTVPHKHMIKIDTNQKETKVLKAIRGKQHSVIWDLLTWRDVSSSETSKPEGTVKQC